MRIGFDLHNPPTPPITDRRSQTQIQTQIHTHKHTPHTHHTHTYTHTTHHKAQIHKQPTSSFPPVTITHMAVERRGQIPTGGFSGSGTSPGSRERETDCDVREERPQAKTAIVKDSAQSVVAPEAGTTKDRCGSQNLAPLAQSM